MNSNEDNSDETKPDVVWIFYKYLGFPIFLIFALYFGVKAVRNQDYVELSKRFVRNNEVIKQEIGQVFRFGEMTGNINKHNNWEITGKVYGERKNIEVIRSRKSGSVCKS